MRVRALLALALLLTANAAEARRAGTRDWRAELSRVDRARLRGWWEAWKRALADARARGAAARITAEGALLVPEAAIDSTAPPDGAYRCRTIKIGSLARDGLPFVAYPPFACRIERGRFVKLTGSQRPVGDLRRDETGRLIFVGAMSLGDEPRALPYGQDPDRDMVGIVERIGPRRWRLVVPQPRWESLLDVIELVPAP